jgi:hypothetical protein
MTIKDVMVRLDGTSGDDARLAAASQIAEIFGSHITGLFFNVLSRDGFDGADAKALHAARKAGDATENMLFQRLMQLQQSTHLRRFDVASEADIADAALPVARTGDAFVAVRPNGRANEPQDLV